MSPPCISAHLFRLAHDDEPRQQLLVAEPRVAHDGAAALDGLDHLAALVAGQREARGVGVDLHRAPQRLLRARGHAAGAKEYRVFRVQRSIKICTVLPQRCCAPVVILQGPKNLEF